MIFKQQQYYAAGYARYSDDDGREGDSCSIESQQMILEQYCKANSIRLSAVYKDDDYTGRYFDRPGFAQMLADIKQGKINLVIVKDLSRFGRNYIDCGRYVEQIFDDYNVRFIAIDDSVDTLLWLLKPSCPHHAISARIGYVECKSLIEQAVISEGKDPNIPDGIVFYFGDTITL